MSPVSVTPCQADILNIGLPFKELKKQTGPADKHFCQERLTGSAVKTQECSGTIHLNTLLPPFPLLLSESVPKVIWVMFLNDFKASKENQMLALLLQNRCFNTVWVRQIIYLSEKS